MGKVIDFYEARKGLDSEVLPLKGKRIISNDELREERCWGTVKDRVKDVVGGAGTTLYFLKHLYGEEGREFLERKKRGLEKEYPGIEFRVENDVLICGGYYDESENGTESSLPRLVNLDEYRT